MIASRTLLYCLLLLCSLPTLADSRCSERPKSLLLPAKISCSHQTTWIDSGVIGARQVIYQTPLGTPPASGWPVVLVYQGSFFPLDNFTYYSNQPFGAGQLLSAVVPEVRSELSVNVLTNLAAARGMRTAGNHARPSPLRASRLP